MVNFFFTRYMANDDISQPPRHADSKNLIFIFRRIWVRVTSGGAWGSVSVGFWGARQLSLLGGGVLAIGLYRPPPPRS